MQVGGALLLAKVLPNSNIRRHQLRIFEECAEMAVIANPHIAAFLILLSVIFTSSELRLVSAYRPFQFAFVHSHFPLTRVVTATLKTLDQPSTSRFPNVVSNRYVLDARPVVRVTATRNDSSGSASSAPPSASVMAGRKYETLSKKWLLIIILTPAALFATGLAVLLVWACCKRRGKSNLTPGMLIWTNQSTLQRRLDCELSPESFKTKGSGAWMNPLHDFTGCTKSGVPCTFPYSLLQAATNNFSSSNLLGEGTFGHVFKASLDYGVYAAVKRLTNAGKQGEKEFQAEVDLMRKIRHPNLVALLGFSNDGPEWLLVYELMQNGSLHDQLHGPSNGNALTWHSRLKIALEVARGLEHLHENCKPAVIHRDLKASNILLDASFNAKVSDFGLALTFGEGSSPKDDIQVQGTFGYVAPEYLMDGTLTEKSDVYGFGVVLLELLTGRLPVDASKPAGTQSLVTWAKPLFSDRAKMLESIDPSLQTTVNLKHLYQVAAVAVLCVQSEPSYRPLIADVVQSLVPLVPQELGGAWRDPTSIGGSKKLSHSSIEFCETDSHLQTSSKSFKYSVTH